MHRYVLGMMTVLTLGCSSTQPSPASDGQVATGDGATGDTVVPSTPDGSQLDSRSPIDTVQGSIVGLCELCSPELLCQAGAECVSIETDQGFVERCVLVGSGCTCSVERCDGLDNDCDGSTDEAYASLGQACSGGVGQCDGLGVLVCSEDGQDVQCMEVSRADGAFCDDGDPCTEGDACQGGLCVSGLAATCDDERVCTLDSCTDFVGCQHELLPGSCLIDGACQLQGEGHPTNACLYCLPSASESDWALVPNPSETEVCEDLLDNNCNGTVDEEGCFEIPETLGGAQLRFVVEGATVAGSVVDFENDTYVGSILDFGEPGEVGAVRARVGEVESPPYAFSVAHQPPAEIQVVCMRKHLYVDSATTRLIAQVVDARGRSVQEGTLVEATFGGLGEASCETDLTGRCTVEWTAPPEAFEVGGTLLAGISSGGVAAVPVVLQLMVSDPPLLVTAPGAWTVLPAAPSFPGDSVVVPVYLSAPGTKVGSYDVHIAFDSQRIEPVAFQLGSCTAFGLPVSNIGGAANSSGLLKMNAINTGLEHSCAGGTDVHVVDIVFEVKSFEDGGSEAVMVSFLPIVKDLYSVNLAAIAQDTLFQWTGAISVWAPVVQGLLAQTSSGLLRDRTLLGQPAETANIVVDAFRRDFSFEPVINGIESSSPAVVAVDAVGNITTAGTLGLGLVTATKEEHTTTATIEVIGVTAVNLLVEDPVQNPIADWDGGLQPIEAKALASWSNGAGVLYEEDVSEQLLWSVEGGLISASTGAGTLLDEFVVVQAPDESVLVNDLSVVAPCSVQTAGLWPGPLVHEESQATAMVTGRLSVPGDGCELQVYANLSDGSRMEITDQPGLELLSTKPGVVSVTAGGALLAISMGDALVIAKWQGAFGKRWIHVGPPGPVMLLVSPLSGTLALSDTDPAATKKGLPASLGIQVKVLFDDGTTQEITNDPGTQYEANGVLEVLGGGLLVATGSATGEQLLTVSSETYPTLSPVSVSFTVVAGLGLEVSFVEPYQASGASVPESTLSLIEGTGVWQRARYEVLLTYTDGTSEWVSTASDLNVVAGEFVSVDPSAAMVQGVSPGLANVQFNLAALSSTVPLTVDEESVDLTSLEAVQAGEVLQVIAWFSDGTRSELTGSDSGLELLTYSVVGAPIATVDSTGHIMPAANGETSIEVTITEALDTGAVFEQSVLVDWVVNLTPDCGDFDLGEVEGLAYPPRSVGESFTVAGRLNTCGQSLGSFHVMLSYDPAVIAVSGIGPGADLEVLMNFIVDTTSVPGQISIQSALNPAVSMVAGADLSVFDLHMKAVASGVSNWDGQVLQVISPDGVTLIGPSTPRPMAAVPGALKVL